MYDFNQFEFEGATNPNFPKKSSKTDEVNKTYLVNHTLKQLDQLKGWAPVFLISALVYYKNRANIPS